MALKSVSSTATSLLGVPATAGAAAGSSGSHAADAANAAGSSSPGNAPGGAGISFVQLLTQSAATSSAEGSAKTTEVPPQEKSAQQDDESGSDSVAMAFAMVSQSLAQAASAAAPATAAAGGNVSSAKSDTGQIPAALTAAAKVASAAAAAGAAAGAIAAGGPGEPGTGAAAAADADGADGADSGTATDSAANAQKFFALLTQGAEATLGTQASKDATSSDSPQSNSQGNSDNGPTVTSSAANAHLSVGSHFSVHSANDAKPSLDVKSPVGSPAWADDLGGKITWMAHQGIESASLRLSPAHLGPVEVRISVQDGGASVWFGAAQPDTRAALEQALPRLREMFSTQGLTLADANVSRDPPKQQHQPTAINGVAAVTGVSELTAPQPSSSLSLRIGLLDTYA